jgi:VWFA-related protein
MPSIPIRLPLLTGLLLLAAAAPMFPAPPAPPSVPTSFGDTVDVNVVNVEVYVTDKDGHRVPGLKKEDFSLSEDGRKVEVVNFAAVDRPPSAPVPAAPPPGVPTTPAPVEAPPPVDPNSVLSLVVFVDNVHILPEHRTRAVEQIRQFLKQNVHAGDRVMLATLDVNLRDRLPFTADGERIDAALREAENLPSYGQQEDQGRRTAYNTMVELYEIDNGCGPDVIKPVEGFAQQTQADALRTVGALRLTVSSLSGVPGRKAVLFVSDGVPITPGEELYEAAYDLCTGKLAQLGYKMPQGKSGPSGDSSQMDASGIALDAQKYSVAKKLEDLAAQASANGVTFYTLQASGLRGNAAADASYGAEKSILQDGDIQQIQTSNLKGSLTALADDTGGRFILDTNNFLPELARMQEDFDSYYSLGYSPGHSGDGKVHQISVKLKRPGLRVRYRPSYRDKPAVEKMVDRTLAALLHGIEDNPLGVAVEIGDLTPAEGGDYAVPVRLKIPLFKLAILNQQGNYVGKLRLVVAVRDDAGGLSPLRQVEVPLNIPRKEVLNALGQYYLYTLTLKMKPGAQHFAVAVRDELGATTSYLSRPVTVGAAVAAANP